MAAQLEDGYTRIANQILEEISKQKLNGTQFRILMVVWRFTYGFNRKDHEMSLSFFEKATELGKTQIDRELKNLITTRVLVVTKESTYTSARKLGFNKKFNEWDMDSQQKRRESAKTLTVSQNAEEQSANMSTGTVSQNADQDIHSFKENFKDIQEEEEQTAMDAYIFSFKKMMYTGHIQDYVMKLLDRGCTDSFIREVFLEMGERGINADVNYMRKVAEDWILKGIKSRQESKEHREAQKAGVNNGGSEESVRQGGSTFDDKPITGGKSGALPSSRFKFDENGDLQVSGM